MDKKIIERVLENGLSELDDMTISEINTALELGLTKQQIEDVEDMGMPIYRLEDTGVNLYLCEISKQFAYYYGL